MKNVLWILAFIAVGFVAYYYYIKPRVSSSSMSNGDIVSSDLMSPEQKAKFLRENAGEDADGQSEHKTTHGNISAGDAAPAPVASTSTLPAASTTASGSASKTAIPGSPVVEPAPASTTAAATTYPTPSLTTTSASTEAPPTSDTIAPNPPNGMVFSGKGTFQWYRQGNITWRVDTVTGRSCIVFATDDEWRKPRVLSHGCGRSA